MLFPLSLPAGVFRNGTEYQSVGRWFDANLVRFYEGTIRPIGGWRKTASTQLTGTARGLFAWRDNAQNRWAAVGTNSKLYVYNGGSVYDVTPVGLVAGRQDAFAGVGYGFGPYGSGAYGAKPNVTTILDPALWSFDNWGEWLVGCSNADGKLYVWEPGSGTGTAATAISGAPTGNLGLIVSAERYLFAFGAGGDPRNAQWSDQGDFTTWTPTVTNTAGNIRMQTAGKYRASRNIRGQIVVWTDVDLHAFTYLGPPLVYGIEKVGAFCGLVGPQAIAVVESGAVWMSNNGFFRYDGALHDLPCDVSDYVFSDFNTIQKAKTYAGHNSLFGEVWWFYPSSASTENDRYVIWNYREGHWSIGKLPRTAWTDSGVFPYPLAVGADGYLYEHENGWTADGSPLVSTRYLKAGPVQIGTGDKVMAVNQVVPDERTQGQIQLQFATQFTPEGPAFSYGPYSIKPYTDVRFSGRQISMDVVGNADADWRLGVMRLDAIQAGRR